MPTVRSDEDVAREAVLAVADLRWAFERFDTAPTFAAQSHAADLIAEKATLAASTLAAVADRALGDTPA